MKKLDPTKKKRTEQQKRWLRRQINDPYVERSHKEGYRSRAAYKLIEINDKFKLLHSAQKILDLGAAPGSWLQVAQKKVGKSGIIVGVDLVSIEAIAGVTCLEGDFRDETILSQLYAIGPFDGIISDMAASSTGFLNVDQLKMAGLIEELLDYLPKLLALDGFFIFKTFQGGLSNDIQKRLKQLFKTVKHVKPAASRSDSRETYVVCLTRSPEAPHQSVM
jgi:23S rRNA (uridine2552-2'-O)-methyltransferase